MDPHRDGVLFVVVAAVLGSAFVVIKIDVSLSSVPLTGWASAFGAGLLHVVSHGLEEYTTAAS